MAEHLIVAEIQCQCGVHVTVRAIQGTYGGTHTVACWHCKSKIELKGTQGYCEGKKANTQIISKEVRKK